MRKTWIVLPGLLVIGISIFLGIKMGIETWLQYQTNGFIEAPGMVLESEVQVGRSSRGSTTYSPRIRYEYTVDGERYESTSIRFGTVTGDSAARTLVDQFPPFKEVTVYHDSNEPNSVVLERFLRGRDLIWVLMLTPFLGIGVGLTGAAITSLFRRRKQEIGTDIQIVEDSASCVRLRLPVHHPFAQALITLFGATIAVLCAIGFLTGMSPSTHVVIGSWLGCLAVSGAVFAAGYFKLRQGHYDLVIDRARRTITFPRIYGVKTEEIASLQDLTEVGVNEQLTKDSKGGYSRIYEVVLRLTDGSQRKIASYHDQDTASTLSRWLAGKL